MTELHPSLPTKGLLRKSIRDTFRPFKSGKSSYKTKLLSNSSYLTNNIVLILN